MEDFKTAMVSGRLVGTRSLVSDIDKLDNPDDVEIFLREFDSKKFEFDTNNSIKYINDDQDFLECLSLIEASQFISIYPTPSFARLYITTDDNASYILRLNRVSTALIASFIAKEKPIKFALNSFSFIKWCNKNNIDIRNIYDTPTYIKLLTNDVDPLMPVEEYLKKYTSYTLLENDNETNSIIIGNFIYEIGKYLSSYIEKFDLASVCKSINENTYFECNDFNNSGTCTLHISYLNINSLIENLTPSIIEKYKDNAYIVSPLNRIAPKFGNTVSQLIKELYNEDVSISLLNELYNNNIHAILNDDNSYTIKFKSKNFNSIISLINAIFNDTFNLLFGQAPELHMECIIKQG